MLIWLLKIARFLMRLTLCKYTDFLLFLVAQFFANIFEFLKHSGALRIFLKSTKKLDD
jgi:hypothetical protein